MTCVTSTLLSQTSTGLLYCLSKATFSQNSKSTPCNGGNIHEDEQQPEALFSRFSGQICSCASIWRLSKAHKDKERQEVWLAMEDKKCSVPSRRSLGVGLIKATPRDRLKQHFFNGHLCWKTRGTEGWSTPYHRFNIFAEKLVFISQLKKQVQQ